MNFDGSRILLVDDETSFREEFKEFLELTHGYVVTALESAAGLISQIENKEFDLLILDQHLGKRDILPMLEDIRRVFKGPVVILSGNVEEADRVMALELGVDDFILKTQSTREIVARIRAALRRAIRPQGAGLESHADAPHSAETAAELPEDGWSLNLRLRELRAPDGTIVTLTGVEFELLRIFAAHPGEVISREMFYTNAFRRPFDPKERALDNLMSRLRAKFAPFSSRRETIKSIRGRGYALVSLNLHVMAGHDSEG